MCIDEQLLSAYLDNELIEPYKTQVEEHLSYCSACRLRLEKLRALDETIKSTELSDDVLDAKMNQTLSFLEKKYFAEDKPRVNFFRRKIEMGLSTMITAAAAVVVVYIGGFVLFGLNSKQTDEILPSVNVQANSQNVHLVSQNERGLDSFSLEQILQYLDSKGYDVDISIKGLKPLDE